MDEAKFLVGLVRATAKDGSIWWTFPENASHFEALETAIVQTSEEFRAGIDSYNRWYEDKTAKIWKAHDEFVAERTKTSQLAPGAMGGPSNLDRT